MCIGLWVTVCMERSKVNFVELLLSFQLPWGPGIEFRSPDLCTKCRYPLSDLLQKTGSFCICYTWILITGLKKFFQNSISLQNLYLFKMPLFIASEPTMSGFLFPSFTEVSALQSGQWYNAVINGHSPGETWFHSAQHWFLLSVTYFLPGLIIKLHSPLLSSLSEAPSWPISFLGLPSASLWNPGVLGPKSASLRARHTLWSNPGLSCLLWSPTSLSPTYSHFQITTSLSHNRSNSWSPLISESLPPWTWF